MQKRKSIIVMSLSSLLAGCRSPGLPPEPPEHDAANPDVGVVKARPQANPFTRSAFEGVKLDGGGGHEHHHHGHGAAKAKPAEAPAAEAPAAEAPAAEAPAAEAPAAKAPAAKAPADPHASHGGRA